MKLLHERRVRRILGLSPSRLQTALPVPWMWLLPTRGPDGWVKCWSVHHFNFHCFLSASGTSGVHETIPSLFQGHVLMRGGWCQCLRAELVESELVCSHLREELKPKASPSRGLESHHYWRQFREEWKKWLVAWRDRCMRKDQSG